MANMAAGACVGGGCSDAIKGGLTALSNLKNEDKKEVASTEQRNATDPGKLNNELTDNRASKIFGGREGHVPDTPANRSLLKDVANDPKAQLGTDKFGNQWAAKTLDNGTQAWTQSRSGQVWNGGINSTPRAFNSETGMTIMRSRGSNP